MVIQLVMRDYSCRLWVRLGGQLYFMTLTDSAASVQPPWVITANFGAFAIEMIESSSRGAILEIVKLMMEDAIGRSRASNVLQQGGNGSTMLKTRLEQCRPSTQHCRDFRECVDVFGVSCVAPEVPAAWVLSGRAW